MRRRFADLKGALATLAVHWTDADHRRIGDYKSESIEDYKYEKASTSASSRSDAPTGLPEVDAVILAWRKKRRRLVR